MIVIGAKVLTGRTGTIVGLGFFTFAFIVPSDQLESWHRLPALKTDWFLRAYGFWRLGFDKELKVMVTNAVR